MGIVFNQIFLATICVAFVTCSTDQNDTSAANVETHYDTKEELLQAEEVFRGKKEFDSQVR